MLFRIASYRDEDREECRYCPGTGEFYGNTNHPCVCPAGKSFKPRSRARSGGKPASDVLLRPITGRKRSAFLRWMVEGEPTGRTIEATMHQFQITRQNVVTNLRALHREHGIGYAITKNTITVDVPPDAPPPGNSEFL